MRNSEKITLIEFAETLAGWIEPIENDCLCINPPGPYSSDGRYDIDNPRDHAYFCPVFLSFYIHTILKEETSHDNSSSVGGKNVYDH